MRGLSYPKSRTALAVFGANIPGILISLIGTKYISDDLLVASLSFRESLSLKYGVHTNSLRLPTLQVYA